jgi:hypothetical protein
MASKPKFNPDQPFQVAEPSKPKFDPNADFTPVEQEPNTSMLEAAKTFGLEGASFGLDDELGGALEAAGQFAGVKGLGAPTISETELQSPVGFDYEKLLNAYQTARDRRRNIKEQQRTDRPGTALAANIVGGVATGLKLPMNLPSLAAQGAASSAGMSEADLTQGDVGQFALDTGLGAGLGVGLGKLAPIAGSAPLKTGIAGAAIGGGSALMDENATGEDIVNRTLSGGLIGAGAGLVGAPLLKGVKNTLSGAANKVVPTGVKAFNMANTPAGQESVDVTSRKFQDDFMNEAKNIADDASSVITGVKNDQAKSAQAAEELFNKHKEDTLQTFQSQIDDIMQKQSQFEEAEVLKNQSLKTESYNKLANAQRELADAINTDVKNVEKDVVQNINEVYDLANEKGLTVNTADVVENLKASIPENMLSKKVSEQLDSFSGDIGLDKARELKNLLYKIGGSSDKNVSQAAKEAYWQTSNNVITQLADQGETTLAENLKLNNQKYKLLQDFNDDFIGYKDSEVKDEAIKLLKDFVTKDSDAKTMAQASTKAEAASKLEKLLTKLRKINPEMAQSVEMAGAEMAQSAKQIEAIPTNVKLPPNQDISRLQQMMDQTKKTKFEAPPVTDSKFSQFKSDDQDEIAKKFLGYIDQSYNKDNNFPAQQELNRFFADVEKTKGPEFKAQLQQKMQALAEKREVYAPEMKIQDVFTVPGLARTAVKGQATVGANLGKATKKLVTEPTALITDKVGQITDDLIARIDTQDKTLAKMLDNVRKMPPQQQQRSMFAIMQNPVWRNKINQDQETKK